MKKAAYAIFLALFLSSCATIISSKVQEVTFNSVPEGAKVLVNGKVIGITPLTTHLPRIPKQTLAFEKEGFQRYETGLSTGVNPWLFGNILIGGLLGSTTDNVTGAMYEYQPSQYLASLVPTAGAHAKSEDHQIIDFIVINFETLKEELAARNGEHLQGLAGFTGQARLSDKDLDELSALISAYDAKEFAQAFLRKFVK